METQSKLIAIVGGSGAGKTWLAERLQRAFGNAAARLSLDDFYLDRSPVPAARRAKVNFDHPRAIDWALAEQVLRDCRAGRPTRTPHYSFLTHVRLPRFEIWTQKPLVIVDGLWLLCRPAVRALFDLRIFLDCPTQLRLERRLARDVAERGRSPDSVRDQFWKTVAPMHDQHVAPQVRWADLVLKQPSSENEIEDLIETIQALIHPCRSISPGGPASLTRQDRTLVQSILEPEPTFSSTAAARRTFQGCRLSPGPSPGKTLPARLLEGRGLRNRETTRPTNPSL